MPEQDEVGHLNSITGYCDRGEGCSLTLPGHHLTVFNRRISASQQNGWKDANVIGFTAAWAVLEDWEDGTRCSIWWHGDLREVLRVGDLVSLHRTRDVLAIADERYSVMITEESVL